MTERFDELLNDLMAQVDQYLTFFEQVKEMRKLQIKIESLDISEKVALNDLEIEIDRFIGRTV